MILVTGLFWLVCFTLGYCIDTRSVRTWYDPEQTADKPNAKRAANPVDMVENALRRLARALKEAPANEDEIHDTPIGRNWSEFWTRLPDNSFRLLEIFLFWTWTNILFLCCAAALIGQYGAALYAKRRVTTKFASALMKGLLVYLLAITGQLVTDGSLHHHHKGELEPDLRHTDSAHYFRIAGVSSFIAFTLGYHPELLIGIGRRLSRQDDKAADVKGHPYP